jgi:hypothetical protein
VVEVGADLVDSDHDEPRLPGLEQPADGFDVLLWDVVVEVADERSTCIDRRLRALHDLIASTAVVYSWNARAARLRFLARRATDEVSAPR